MNRFTLRALSFAFLAIPVSAAFAGTYTITDLGGLGGPYYYGYGLNEAGVAVGASTATPTDTLHAVKYSAGTTTALVTSGPVRTTYGLGINEAGTVVGDTYRLINGSSYERAVIYDNGQAVEVTAQGSSTNSSSARAISNNGIVAGWSTDKGGFTYNVATHTTTYVGTLTGATGNGGFYGTNDDGSVLVGTSPTSTPNSYHAVKYSGGTMTDIGSLGGFAATATSVNQSGVIVGWSYTSGVNDKTAFVYSGGVMTALGKLGAGATTAANAINDQGTIVGVSAQKAVIFNGGSAVDLTTLLAPGITGWSLSNATAINNHGQIVGWGFYGGGIHGFILTPTAPVPEPGTWAVLGLGAAALLRRRRKA